ncbi:hypothetical protein CC2G_002117 [Coprinopsis cinerea AmutBmut pab1-1]|nr:hypothetical protein CC2G_002117 [Coprinopsis cinerea AmutBmut pab1-1]
MHFQSLCVVLLGAIYVTAHFADAEEGISARELGLDNDWFEAREFYVEDLVLREDILSQFSTRELLEEIYIRGNSKGDDEDKLPTTAGPDGSPLPWPITQSSSSPPAATPRSGRR